MKVRAEKLLAGGRLEGANVHLMVATDPIGHRRIDDGDSEIIDRARATEARSPAPVLFITGDTGAALRARAAGLQVRKVPTPDPESD